MTAPESPARTAERAPAGLAIRALPRLALAHAATPLDELAELRRVLGNGPRLFVKRDDVIAFGGGGNKVRKLEAVGAAALASGADTLVTCGSLQSNHARATAAVAARLGLHCVLILNGAAGTKPTGNHLLMRLLGADIVYVESRSTRVPAMDAAVERLRAGGRRPYAIPIGASTALGAAGFARAIAEIIDQGLAPDVIVHASSSGGTQAGVLAGCLASGLRTEVIGVSVDDPAAEIAGAVRVILGELGSLIDDPELALAATTRIQVDERFIGAGYGIATDGSAEALSLAARHEGLILDPVYTAKAMAALIAYIRQGRFAPHQTVLFWHTGGIPGLFA